MKAAAKRFNAALDKLVPSFRRDVAKEKNRYILAQIEAYKRLGRLDEALTYTHEAMLQNIFRKHYLRIFKRSVSQSAELAPQLKSLIPKWQIKREDYEEYLGQWYRGGAADYIYETAKTTENDMRRLMRRAFESELPESEVIKAGLRARGLSAMRADTIARTETHKAAMFASKKSVEDIADQAGVVMVKEWNAVQDERTRISHQEADGQTAEMDEPFQIDGDLLDRPGDPNGSADQIINCSCVMTYSVKSGR